MKMKKFMFTASSLAVGASLISTVLTSCGKATIDDKLKIDLNDNGYLSNDKTQADFKLALKDALSRSSNWAQFKSALADEIVYRWYVDRAAENKDSTTKNTTFRVNLDEWTDKIKKDYDETIKSLKNKYGDKWEFYLQNETLNPMGGTEESYKHAKLVEKVRAEFLSKVFATNYFGYRTEKLADDKQRAKYPHIYSKASINLSEDKLNDPVTWGDLGFWARTNTSFTVDDSKDDIDASYLSKNPDGDYAQIQNYVFDRWFKTEKPFFSAAALFKYSNPKYVADGKLASIYNGTSTGVKIPDNPNESFPFFGGLGKNDANKGTKAFASFFEQAKTNGFTSLYQKDGAWVGNGTVSIPKTMTEDSQTLLLSFGSQMIGGAANALYIPYANAAASLYMQMMTVDQTEAATYKCKNTRTEENIIKSFHIDGDTTKGYKDTTKDNNIILSNFFFNGTEAELATAGVTSYADLTKLFPSGKAADFNASGEYHCPLFKDDKDYTFLYGVKSTNTSGIKYITNAFQTEITPTGEEGKYADQKQPWIFELNESGMHAQTIDGYQSIAAKTTVADKQEAAKNVLKYRLMQKKCGYNDGIISGDVFGDSGKLKAYFNDNFTNIILELAFDTTLDVNVFRSVDSYKNVSEVKTDDLFLNKILTDEKLWAYNDMLAYLKATITYDNNKKYLDAYETANSKTFAYRTKQMENARTEEKDYTIYENGLLAPIPYSAETSTGATAKTYITAKITKTVGGELSDITRATIEANKKAVTDLLANKFDATTVDSDSGFAPQIKSAKAKSSNRFWYKSHLVDKMMYQYMSNKEGLPNYIKGTAMEKYVSTKFKDHASFEKLLDANFDNAYAVTYAESKLFTNDRNFANFGTQGLRGYEIFARHAENKSLLIKAFEDDYQYKITTNGEYCDDYLNYRIYLATVAYLIGENKDFENFYKILNTKISEDEMALVGYINKTNKNVFGSSVENPTTQLKDGTNPYYWTADVNNIFDNTTGYAGGGKTGDVTNAKIACDQYWKVINKTVGLKGDTADNTFAGFTGIQTKASNSIDSGSKLQEAAFTKFAKSSDYTRVLTGDTATLIDNGFAENVDGVVRYVDNYGCWFAYAGTKANDGKTTLSFSPVKWEGHDDITTDTFKKGDSYLPSLKLAKKIAENRSLDDLRSLAKKLGDTFYGSSLFKEIGDGTKKINDVNELRWTMLNELKQDSYLKCFQRMTDAELHEEGSDKSGSKKYGFTDSSKGDTYRILMTQINKADVVEKNFAPTWDATNNVWVANANSAVAIQEFWYIFCNMAMESSVQQQAISEVVKTVYGDEKLIVYDAQLYNCFDSVWIKDWSKKTIGA